MDLSAKSVTEAIKAPIPRFQALMRMGEGRSPLCFQEVAQPEWGALDEGCTPSGARAVLPEITVLARDLSKRDPPTPPQNPYATLLREPTGRRGRPSPSPSGRSPGGAGRGPEVSRGGSSLQAGGPSGRIALGWHHVVVALRPGRPHARPEG